MRRPATAEERAAQSARLKAAWARGDFDDRPTPRRRDSWRPEEDDDLRRLAGTMPLADVAARVSERFAWTRTETACRIRCTRLGISAWPRGYSMRDLTGIFGYDHRVIKRWWVAPGLLAGRRWTGRGPHDGWWFDQEAVEWFVRACGWAYDPARMKPGHRLTRLADTVHRADPWRTFDELVRYLELAPVNVTRWLKRGLIPHRRRPKAGPGAGLIVIRGRDFLAIKRAIQAAQQTARATARARFVALRRRASAEAATRTTRFAGRLVGACRNQHPRTPETTRFEPNGKIVCLACRTRRERRA